MASQASIVNQVRQLVHDVATPLDGLVPPGTAIYVDTVYINQINFGLQKLNYDFGQSPAWTIATLPPEMEFLLVKLTTINMCYIRSTEQEDVVAADDGLNIGSISAPDISVTESLTVKDVYSNFLDIADRLQDEYDGELEGRRAKVSTSSVQVGIMTRQRQYPWGPSRAHFNQRERVPRQVVVDPPKVENFQGVVISGVVIFTWSPWRNTDFERYEIWRNLASGFTRHTDGALKVRTVDINQTARFDQEDEPAGTWYYLIYAVNKNLIFGPESDEVTVTL